MQIGEAFANAAFLSFDKTCPMEPHSEGEGFKAEQQKNDKDVPRLHSAMKSGKSTRRWEQVSADSFKQVENKDGPVQPVPKLDKKPITIDGESYPLSLAAHHLIPGEESLPVSNIRRYIWSSEGFIKTDIGYDVDGSENGMWLPTHQVMSNRLGKAQKIKIEDDAPSTQGMSAQFDNDENIVINDDDAAPPPTQGMSWEALSARAKKSEQNPITYTELFLPRYTQQAMMVKGLEAQFHDRHSNYSTWVTDRLNEIDTLIHKKSAACEKCPKDTDRNRSPPYMLVYRLNRLSNKLRSILQGSPRLIWKTVYTSDYARRYATNPLSADKLGL